MRDRSFVSELHALPVRALVRLVEQHDEEIDELRRSGDAGAGERLASLRSDRDTIISALTGLPRRA